MTEEFGHSVITVSVANSDQRPFPVVWSRSYNVTPKTIDNNHVTLSLFTAGEARAGVFSRKRRKLARTRRVLGRLTIAR